MTSSALAGPALAASATMGMVQVLDSCTGPAWRRLNFRGRPVTLSLGPAAVAGLLSGLVVASERQIALPAGVAIAGAGVAGFFDDRASAREDERVVKGFAGHFGALAHGNASAGAVKLSVIGGTSLAAAAIRTGRSVDTAIDGALVAGCANLVNLLDLRPGRALKVAGLATLALIPGTTGPYRGLARTVAATVAAALPADLGERSMSGDTGANALGAAVGSLLCDRSRRVRLLSLGVVVGLTAVSEKVSFSAVISGNRVLRRLDQLGVAHD